MHVLTTSSFRGGGYGNSMASRKTVAGSGVAVGNGSVSPQLAWKEELSSSPLNDAGARPLVVLLYPRVMLAPCRWSDPASMRRPTMLPFCSTVAALPLRG